MLTLSDIYVGIYIILVLLIIFTIYTFFKSVDYYRLTTKKDTWNKLIDDEILLHLFEDKAIPTSSIEDKMKSDVFKQFFIEKIIHSLDYFSGSYKVKIKNIFSFYQLNQFTFKKINQKNPYILAQGIRELIIIEDKDALIKIKSFINHPNREVQEECQYGLVHFLGFDGLYFLDHLKNKLSEWQQIRLLSILPTLPNYTDNEFEKIVHWLNSPNDSIVIFVLKIIKKSQILKSENYLFELLINENPNIVTQTIKTFSVIHSNKTADALIKHYPNQPIDRQIEILKSLIKLDLSHQKKFLIHEIVNQANLSIKKHAINLYLRNISSIEEVAILVDFEEVNTLETKTILLEVSNMLISELNDILHQPQKILLKQIILDYK